LRLQHIAQASSRQILTFNGGSSKNAGKMTCVAQDKPALPQQIIAQASWLTAP
jgi:hypothetical protein